MLDVTVYKLPNGAKEVVTFTHVKPEDAKFFSDNEYAVSAEELRDGAIVLYATTGLITPDGDEYEEIYVVPRGQSCLDAMSALRERVEYIIKNFPR